MPKRFECCRCGVSLPDKGRRIVSRFTGRAYCLDERACQRRVKRNAKKAQG